MYYHFLLSNPASFCPFSFEFRVAVIDQTDHPFQRAFLPYLKECIKYIMYLGFLKKNRTQPSLPYLLRILGGGKLCGHWPTEEIVFRRREYVVTHNSSSQVRPAYLHMYQAIRLSSLHPHFDIVTDTNHFVLNMGQNQERTPALIWKASPLSALSKWSWDESRAKGTQFAFGEWESE